MAAPPRSAKTEPGPGTNESDRLVRRQSRVGRVFQRHVWEAPLRHPAAGCSDLHIVAYRTERSVADATSCRQSRLTPDHGSQVASTLLCPTSLPAASPTAPLSTHSLEIRTGNPLICSSVSARAPHPSVQGRRVPTAGELRRASPIRRRAITVWPPRRQCTRSSASILPFPPFRN
jgi:hypothetical protein